MTLLNKTLSRAQDLAHPIRLFSIPPKNILWMSWSDASLANQDGEGLQIAYLNGLTSRATLTEGRGLTSLLPYASKTMKKIGSSTLMTEACVLTSCLSDLEWWIEWWKSANLAHYKSSARSQMLPIDHRLQEPGDIEGVCIVDTRSLSDYTVGKCKKAALEALIASDTLLWRKLTVRWQPHEWNLSDPLMRLICSGLAQPLPCFAYTEPSS
eukprot:6364586-Amphidinium_carterae.1